MKIIEAKREGFDAVVQSNTFEDDSQRESLPLFSRIEP